MKTAIHPNIGSGKFDPYWSRPVPASQTSKKSQKRTRNAATIDHIVVKRDAQGTIDYSYYAQTANSLRADAVGRFFKHVSALFKG